MKTSIPLLLTLFTICAVGSCEFPEYGPSLGRTRWEAMTPARDSSKGGGNSVIPESADTTFFFSAVDFPADYDWVRDSCGGRSPAHITLYRNFEPVLSIPSGKDFCISNDPDSHHIAGGHLFTEYSTTSETIVKCDGEELFRYAGREFLKGLVVEGDDVWTLAQDRSGKGFSLRRNGEAIMLKSDGSIFGDLSLRPQGALYRDGGDMCFCYCATVNGRQVVRSVRGNDETEYTSGNGEVIDAIMDNGVCTLLLSGRDGSLPAIVHGDVTTRIMDGYSGSISEGYLFSGVSGTGAAGFYSGYISESPFITENGESRLLGSCGNFYIYPGVTGTAAVSLTRGTMRILHPDGTELSPTGNFLFFDRNCAAAVGNGMVVALNRTDTGKHPELLSGKESRQVDVNGYISCIAQ